MGTSTSQHEDLSTNEYLERFAKKEHISSNDPFWNRFLSFSFTPPSTLADHQILDERVEGLCRQLITNNLQSGNYGSLLHVFLGRASELLASTQTENNMFSWQTYNALFIIRCIAKYFVENLKEDDMVRQFEARPKVTDVTKREDENINRLEVFMDSLIEIVVDVPVKDFTYPLHLESVNCLLVLLSVQMFTQKPAAKSCIYRSLMQGRYSIHSPLLMKTLLQHFVNREKAPPGLHGTTAGGSLVIGLASELWNILTFGLGRSTPTPPNPTNANGMAARAVIAPSDSPLANQSLLLILVLANHCTGDKAIHNPYRQALFSCTNSQDRGDATPTRAVATFKLDLSRLYVALCRSAPDDQTTLLLYLLLHRNTAVRCFVLEQCDIQHLVVLILRTLYHAPDSNSHHIYMSLIILLILSEDDLFNKTVHSTMLGAVPWYTERSISDISLGGLLVLVVIRTIQYNMLRMRDKYLHTNCLAALANMSARFRGLHPYVSQRLVSLFETLARKHGRLAALLAAGGSTETASDLVQDLTVLEEVLRMVLEILNSCLTHQLPHNPNLVYTLLYKRHIFEPFRTHSAFQDIVHNIDAVIVFFSNKLDEVQRDLSVSEVLSTIQQGAHEWPRERLKGETCSRFLQKFPDLKFKYVEEDQPEDFFIPYVWSLVCQASGIYWNPTSIKLFTLENGCLVV